MRAVTVSKYGGVPALTDMPDPQPGPGQLLIRVEAAGVNPMDRMIAAGALQATMPGQFPLILGSDLAGTIEALGEGARRFVPGENVFGQLLVAPLGSAGTYAERVAVSEAAPLARVPQGLDPLVAAALPTAGAAALEIVDSLEPLAGKTLLLVGAAGGIGSFATQLAANAGAHVIAVARADAAARLRAYGAEEVLDYTETPVVDSVRHTYPDGIDVLVDVVSDADGFAALASLVSPGGTALTTRYVADGEALAARGVAGVNFQLGLAAMPLDASSALLERLADAVVHGQIVAPPIRQIGLDDVVDQNDAGAEGKTVIVP
jgi:NADPH:quinone reductase-like Zn-dependent oxidoreductase